MEVTDKAWITITAALIAAFVSLVNVLIAKDQKITEFRQAWINSVRDEVASFISLALSASSSRHFVEAQQRNQSKQEALAGAASIVRGERARCSECRSRILLFLNPVDDRQIINRVETIYRNSSLASEVPHVDIDKQCQELLAHTQFLLKEEWKRVRRGEPMYYAAKFASAALILLLAVLAIRHWS